MTQIDPRIQAFAHSAVALTRAWDESRRQLAAAFEIALVADAAEGGQAAAEPKWTEIQTTSSIVIGAVRDYVLTRTASHPNTPVDLRGTITQLQLVDAVTKVLVGSEREQAETAADIANAFNAEVSADADRRRVISDALGPVIDSTTAETRAEYLDQMTTAVHNALVAHGAYREAVTDDSGDRTRRESENPSAQWEAECEAVVKVLRDNNVTSPAGIADDILVAVAQARSPR